MSKFTKTLVATAVAGLFAGSAHAVGINAGYATPAGKDATAKFTGSRCKSDKSDLDMTMIFISGGGDAPNTGEWHSSSFQFGLEGDGEGPHIAAKPLKNLTMDLSGLDFAELQQAMANYAGSLGADCKDFDGYNFDTVITQFNAKFSKNLDKVKVKMNAEGTYLDSGSDKDRKVKLKMKSNMDKTID